MEDTTFELLTRMYSEFTRRFDEIEKRFDGRFDGVDAEISGLKKDVRSLKNDVVRIENKLETSTKALFDGYIQTYEKLEVLETKVDGLSQKIDKQEEELLLLKSGK